MSIFALQSPAGGFLDETLQHFNKTFDDWCVQFETLHDAEIIVQSLTMTVNIVEITPLSYPKYFFHTLSGTVYATKQMQQQIICIIEPQMGAALRIAVCDLDSHRVHVLPTKYKSTLSAENAFANFTL